MATKLTMPRPGMEAFCWEAGAADGEETDQWRGPFGSRWVFRSLVWRRLGFFRSRKRLTSTLSRDFLSLLIIWCLCSGSGGELGEPMFKMNYFSGAEIMCLHKLTT